MKKLLITGFEPFGGETVNPSWEAVMRLPETIGEYTLTKRLIPVVFGKAFETVMKTADGLCPDVILCIGQAGGRAAITPELVGINLRHASIPDNDGLQPKDEPILPEGAKAHFSTLPVRKMAAAIAATGAYVCNDVLYTLLSHYEGSDTRVGFIHIPYSTEQGKTPAMEMADIMKGLTAAIENLD